MGQTSRVLSWPKDLGVVIGLRSEVGQLRCVGGYCPSAAGSWDGRGRRPGRELARRGAAVAGGEGREDDQLGPPRGQH